MLFDREWLWGMDVRLRDAGPRVNRSLQLTPHGPLIFGFASLIDIASQPFLFEGAENVLRGYSLPVHYQANYGTIYSSVSRPCRDAPCLSYRSLQNRQ
jgi:hypothetical protein